MTVSPVAAIVIALIGGLASLDRTAFGQFLVSRPLVSASLLGAALGYPYQGAFIGISLELLFLSSLPVGSFIPYHPLYPSVVAVGIFAAVNPGSDNWELVPVAILFALPAVWADRFVEGLWRRSNDGLLFRAEAFFRLGRIHRACALHTLSILRAFVLNAAAILFCVWLLSWLCELYLRLTPWPIGILSLIGLVPFIVGLSGLSATKIRGRGWLGFAGGIVTGLLVWRVI